MTRIESNLLPGEKLLYRCKSSWAVFLVPGLWLLATLYFSYVVPHNFFAQVTSVALIVVTAIAVVKFVLLDYAVSDQRLWVRAGIYAAQLYGIPFEDLNDMSIEQTKLGEFFDYGKITIHTSQGELGPFTMVESPFKLRKELESLNVLQPIPVPIQETKKDRKARLKQEKAEK